MAIQFLCSACGQPIEVDDNMANLTVTCPYCRKVVLTPTQSNLSARPDVTPPGAVPGTPPDTATPFSSVPPVPTQPPGRGVLGYLALVLMVIAVVSGVLFSISWASVTQGIDPNMKPEELNKLLVERMQQMPRHQLAGFYGSCLCTLVTPIVALVLAIIALVKRSRPRWPAITALCVFGAGIVVSCAGAIMRSRMGAPGG
jgi:hypothetical protein